MSAETDGSTTGIYGPVTDWATDIDHADPAYNPRRRRSGPTCASRLPRRPHRPVRRDVGADHRRAGPRGRLRHRALHQPGRRRQHVDHRCRAAGRRRPADHQRPAVPRLRPPLLLPPFAPKQIEPWEPEIRTLCRQRLDEMGDIEPGVTVVDAAEQYAQHIPVNVIARMLGFPVEDDDLFRQFVHDILEGVNRAPEERQAGFEAFDAYIDDADRPAPGSSRDDLTSYLLDVEIDGQKLARDHVRGSIVLLLLAGIDTTWSAIGSSLWHLAAHHRRPPPLVAEPGADADGDRGAPPRVRPGHDGPHGRQGPRLPRLPDEGRRLGAAAVPGRQPRPGAVPPRRRGRHRPLGEPPRRVRARHPPLPRIEPRPARAAGGRRGVPRPLPRLRAGRPRCRPWSVGQIRGPRRLPVRILAT